MQKDAAPADMVCEHLTLAGDIHGEDLDSRLAALALFSGLSTMSRQDVLRHAHIYNFAKGKVLFFQGDPASRLYTLLKGAIKISKDSTDGEEIVLQMLGAGDTILESAVFLNSCFPFTAQIVETATLLSISAPVLRNRMKYDYQLANNFLTLMARGSRNLLREMENSRLKTVEERIGLFLLRQFLAQDQKSRCIKLPHDKALIAAQLNMRRETFSRVLKKMKKHGFTIEKHTITMPDLQALCGFCDRDSADKCTLNGTPNCPHR